MSCNIKNNYDCSIKNFGMDDLSRISIDGSDMTQLNWKEISIPETLTIPELKPNIEKLDQVYANVELTCVKLIETPFAYKVYDRQATEYEITSAGAAINLAAAIDIGAIQAAVAAILAIAGLPVIPEVAALQEALDLVNASFINLTDAITEANNVLAGTCVLASILVSALEAVIAALNALETALNALIDAANALVAVLGALVEAEVAVLLEQIAIVIGEILAAVSAILEVITLIGNTQYFELISNEEGTCLSGRKLIVEGKLKQKVVYTGLVTTQSVHSAHFEIPFSTFLIPYAKFEGLEYEEGVEVVVDPDTCETTTINGFAFDPNNPIVPDINEDFVVEAYIEDIFATSLDLRTIFKNITLFLLAKTASTCS